MFADAHTLRQYSWHLTEADIADISVVINITDGNNYNFFEILQNISKDTVAFKQRRLSEVALQLQYSVDPLKLSPSSSWKPPFKDAVEIIIDKLFAKVKTKQNI